jgi:iron complex outermembrane receptor protein
MDRRLTLLGLALAVQFPISGRTNDETVMIEPVVVHSTRLESSLEDSAAAVSVVPYDQIQPGRQELGLDESLGGVPGVFSLNRYNFAQDLRISVRGFGSRSSFGIRGVRILVDGIPATLPDGQSNVDDIDLGSLERIEVIRGPAGSLYGAAAGGVLSLETETGQGPPFIEGRYAIGDYGFRQAQLKSGGEMGKTSYLVNVADLSFDGYRDYSATERSLVNTKFVYRPDPDSQLTGVLAAVDSPLAQDPGGLTAEQVAEDRRQAAPLNLLFQTGEALRQERVGLGWNRTIDERQGLRARGYLLQRDFDNHLPFSAVELERKAGGVGFEYQRAGSAGALANRVLLGVDLDAQDDERLRRENDDGELGALTADQRERVTSAGLFANFEQWLSEVVRLDLGLRYDRVGIRVDDRFLADGNDSGERTFRHPSPSVSLLWRINDRVSSYARIATAFETPTTVELASPDGGGGFNQDLEPQTAINYEIGARGSLGRATFEAALFRINVDGQLVPFEIPTAPGRFAFENAGASTHDGIELGTRIALAPVWVLGLAYTYSDFRFEHFTDAEGNNVDGNQIPGIPDQLFDLSLSYRDARGLYAALEARYVSGFFADNANTVKIDPYAVVHLHAGNDLSVGRHWLLGLYGGINNLFDEHYNDNVRLNATGSRYYEPAPERNAYAGISLGYEF